MKIPFERRSMRKLVLLLVVLVMVIGVAGVLAQNERLTDGDFEAIDSTNSWNAIVQNATIARVTSPSPVHTGLGAAELTINANNTGNPNILGQRGKCVDISSPLGTAFTFAGYVYVPSSIGTDVGQVRARVTYFTSPGCSGGGATSFSNLAITSRDVWLPFGFTPGTDISSRSSAAVIIEAQNLSTTDTIQIYWDDLSFYDSTPTAVSLQSFSANNTVVSALAFGSLLVLLGGSSLTLLRRRQNRA